MFLNFSKNNFNLYKVALLFLIPILFSTCKGEGLGFTMNYQTDFEIPAGLGVFDIHGAEFRGIPTNINNFLSANNVIESDITGIIPRRAQLSINFANVEFFFVREVVVEIFTDANERGVEVFYREQVPQNTGFTIDLIPSLPDVAEILTQDEFHVRIEYELRDISPQFIETRFDFEFFAKLE